MDAGFRGAPARRTCLGALVARLALALPIQSSRGIVAALGIVIFLLRTVGKTELNLLEDALTAGAPRTPGELDAIPFVAADIDISSDDPAGRAAFEQTLRARVERAYRRLGIADVDYDIQLL